MKIVFMGSSAFALPALQSLMLNKYDIRAVYTQPDRHTGRGQHLMAGTVKQYAVSHGISVFQPGTLRDPREVEILRSLKPDLIIVASFGQILPDAVLQMPHYKCINVHPSLLPKYRGPSPVSSAIINGDKITGVTIMLIVSRVDSGPILKQREIVISDEDTTDLLSEKLAILGADMLTETIPLWIEGAIQPVLQDERQATYTRMETKEDGRLDWNLSAMQLWRRIRAFHSWPGCFTDWSGGRLKINKAVPLEGDAGNLIGQVILLPRSQSVRVAVKTAAGLLGLVTVQPEGRKQMPATDFIAGHSDFIGSIL